ncbi:hypothetical protein ACU4GR_26750 [Methylobacterium oryzae CBMB20]
MTRSHPIPVAVLLAASLPAAAAPQPTSWGPYEKSMRTDGAPSRCLEHRRGLQRAGDARWSVFQVFNDCNRRVQALCDIAYTPGCDYGRDAAVAAHLDAPLEPYGESALLRPSSHGRRGRDPGLLLRPLHRGRPRSSRSERRRPVASDQRPGYAGCRARLRRPGTSAQNCLCRFKGISRRSLGTGR